jgi:hypothetical protein
LPDRTGADDCGSGKAPAGDERDDRPCHRDDWPYA